MLRQGRDREDRVHAVRCHERRQFMPRSAAAAEVFVLLGWCSVVWLAGGLLLGVFRLHRGVALTFCGLETPEKPSNGEGIRDGDGMTDAIAMTRHSRRRSQQLHVRSLVLQPTQCAESGVGTRVDCVFAVSGSPVRVRLFATSVSVAAQSVVCARWRV